MVSSVSGSFECLWWVRVVLSGSGRFGWFYELWLFAVVFSDCGDFGWVFIFFVVF